MSKNGHTMRLSRAKEIKLNSKPISRGNSDREQGIQAAAQWLRSKGYTDLADKMVHEVPRSRSGYPVDLTGRVIGRLTVIKLIAERPRRWLCRCECGTEKTIASNYLLNGGTSSCGCYRAERVRVQNIKHGMHGTRTWRIWQSMVRRSEGRTSAEQRAVYFDRGIRCCEEWKDFRNFLKDMDLCPSDKHTLERIDVNGNYEPSNCKWATYHEQSRNRRNSRKITIDNETLIVTDWAKRSGVPAHTIFARLYLGWPERAAVETPVHGAIQ